MAHFNFWHSVLLYLNRPNLINRRYVGAQMIFSYNIDQENFCPFYIDNRELWDNTSIDQLTSEFKLTERGAELEACDILKEKLPILLVRKLFRKQSLKNLQEHASEPFKPTNDTEFDICILFPDLNLFALISIQYDDTLKNIHLKLDDAISYTLYSENTSKLQIKYLFGISSNYWLEQILLPKVEQWMLTSDSTNNNGFQGSIKMISVSNYCQNYNRMKAKYSLPLLDIWSKVEKTDPIKFIFEDIAIAAYLVTLWQEEEQSKSLMAKAQTFADIGCGNGLLVYILAMEGYKGYGIDVRPRNIWSHYGPNVNLIEMQIDPLDETNLSKIPKCDWLIGNHSDELTPWILYMAANSSFQTRAFLLPCCCYDFSGLKYQRTTDPNKSQYQCYIDFLEQLSEQFGFKYFRDKLRIPSTKRICVVCYDRNYANIADVASNCITDEQNEETRLSEANLKEKRSAIVRERLQIRAALRLREKEETVRNCTRIDALIKQQIIDRLANHLVNDAKSGEQGLTYGEAISLLDSEMREQLKKQCGGLQTFIRNHKYIFAIVNNRIQFQSADQLRTKAGRPKTKECWFFHHHPQGCKLKDSDCGYKH